MTQDIPSRSPLFSIATLGLEEGGRIGVSPLPGRYNPLADCGGWGGPRPSRKFGVVYNMAGVRGVLVRYNNNGRERSMVIGSRRSDELERALRLAANLPKPGLEHESPPK